MKPTRLLTAVTLSTLSSVVAIQAHAADLTISCGSTGAELQLCKDGVARWEKKSGHSVEVVSTPSSSTERLSLYQQILNAQSSDIDVLQIDIVWPGMLASHLVDLNKYIPKEATQGQFQTLIDNNTIDGKLVAMPWYTDAGVLYYRKDLLEKYNKQVPATWQQMTDTAQDIQQAERKAGNDKMWGYVFQGRSYEGLTCNALEWIDSYPQGGTIVDKNGDITIDNPDAAKALTLASSWIGNISPRGVLNYTEEEARGVFQSGNAVFMRNWPYAWALAQSEGSDIKGKVGVAVLPKGGEDGQHVAALGGWNLAVSKYSQHPKLAAELVTYLTSAEEQKHRAIDGAYNPTIESLYKDKDILAATPFFGTLYKTFTTGVPRPSAVTGENYSRVSNAFFNTVHSILSGNVKTEPGLNQLESELKRIKRRHW